jgi:hypothetical protein
MIIDAYENNGPDNRKDLPRGHVLGSEVIIADETFLPNEYMWITVS